MRKPVAARFTPDCLLGVEELSHIDVVFYFHIDADEPIETGARHPRGPLRYPAWVDELMANYW